MRNMRRCLVIIGIIAAVPVAAPALAKQTQPAASEQTRQPPDARYRLRPGDVLDVNFPFVPAFNHTITIQPDGYVTCRAIGGLRVDGLTIPELTETLRARYATILRDPVITVAVQDFEKPYFIVSGEVGKPGKYELRGATTLTQGMALAGGYTEAAKHSNVLLFRRFGATDWLEVKQIDVKKMFASRDLSEDPILRPGDTVFVPKSTFSKVAPFIPKFGWGLYFNPF